MRVDDLDYVIVMDSDGDDNPDDISILLENQSKHLQK
jgi:hypothetical protein